ncbi:RagB/SusD family nutrient uptake outer membrane protein [Pedobacter sp. BS3]|uniref:RagB/SusD family nutrient uptake outer membrane protein n=1 Tax=Pedobacter sp. BS3 TaxID=2567937 RepID=UPI0011EFF837|nr:RagB/SusD family nutrient uptake outer membrane protein [Pedobacter sp. BS3]TZF83081.1 RagB/SusD family nutrient uptake outer membrane protein [Pedobacter sp. BS3]
MKKIFYVFISILTTGLISCKNTLIENPKGFVSPVNFFNSEKECQAAVNGIYDRLYDIYGNLAVFTALEVASDLSVRKVSTNNEDGTFTYTPNVPGAGAIVWQYAYNGIMYANNTISGIKRAPISDQAKSRYIGEAIFLRSLYYYTLTSMFSDVPYIDFALESEELVSKAGTMKRTNADSIRTALMADLEHYAPSLLPTVSGADLGRATQGAAYTLLSHIALFNRNWKKAEWACQQVIDSKKYKLVNNWGDIDSIANNPESIFEIQFTYSATGLKRTHSIYNSFMPYPRSGSTSKYDGVDMGSNTPTTYGHIVPTQRLISYYSANDKRKDHILAYKYKGVEFNRSKSSAHLPWFGPRFWDFKAVASVGGRNMIMFRYADVLLMQAEAQIELDEFDDAKKNLKLIQDRANISDITASDKPGLREQLRRERARELVGEYGRRIDLVRWDIFLESIKSVKDDYADPANYVEQYKQYYPIPAQEVVKNPNLEQYGPYKQ